MTGCLALLLALGGCSTKHVTGNPPPVNQDWSITAAWNYDFTNFPQCSATVTKGCVSGFTWGYLQSGNQVALKTSAVGVCTGATQPETCTDSTNALLGIGTVQYYIVAQGIDNNGVAVSSVVGNGPVDNVTLDAAKNLAVKRQ